LPGGRIIVGSPEADARPTPCCGRRSRRRWRTGTRGCAAPPPSLCKRSRQVAPAAHPGRPEVPGRRGRRARGRRRPGRTDPHPPGRPVVAGARRRRGRRGRVHARDGPAAAVRRPRRRAGL